MEQEPVSTPDSLQDLCIFYCVEHLECLTPHHGKQTGSHLGEEGGGDAVSSDHDLPLTLCDKLLMQYMKTCLPEHPRLQNRIRLALKALLKRKNVCSKLSLLRREILTEANLCDISNSHITSVNLFGCSEYTYENSGIDMLINLNKSTITNLRLNGVLGNHEDGMLYYSFLPDPGTGNHNSSSSESGSESLFSIRGEFCANQRFSVPKSLQSSQTETVTLLHSDGCYKQSTTSDEINWYCFPKLQNFSVINTETHSSLSSELIIWNMLVSNPQLTALCIVSLDIDCWWAKVSKLHHLTSLTLSSCSQHRGSPVSFFQHLTHLENLRHLDLSSAGDCNYTDAEVDQFGTYVQSTTRLTSLELAGTNLSMIVGHNKQCSSNQRFNPVHCLEDCMVPLENRQFRYLGLVNCPYSPYMHKYIPAAKISGLNGGRQVLSALWSYQHNLGLMSSVLDYLTELFSHPEEQDSPLYPTAYVDGLLAFLDQYPDWKCITTQQPTLKVTGKILYQLYKILAIGHKRKKVTIIQRRRLLERMLVLIGNCLRDIEQGFGPYVDYVSRLSLVVLLCLPLPEDAVYCYMLDKYVRTLILVVKRRPKPMLMHLSLRLIHTACRYSQDLKARIGGEFELTKILLSLINDNMEIEEDIDDADVMDTVIEKSWSIIWTLTDEVPSNCAKFIEHGGLDISMSAIELHTENKYELHRKITGALSNIAENHSLRHALCTEDLVSMMWHMLEIDPEGIDVSSHAAAFLVLLAADGPDCWTVEFPGRDTVLREVEATIDKWKLDTSRGVKFRSLSPMLQQMENKETPIAQYWACWMICNLITVKPARYCWMMEGEGGMEILERVKVQDDLYDKVKNLVETILEIMEKNRGIVPREDDY